VPEESAARPYARALWQLAKERGQAEAVGRELTVVAEAIEQTPELRDLLARPWVAASVKQAVAKDVAARLEVSPLTQDLGRLRARVRTAVALTDQERERLRDRLGQALSARQVILEETVDPSLLGGFVAEAGGYLVDASLDAQLARIRDRLASG
jgi:F-type H+-transporting ATPase subunit delta